MVTDLESQNGVVAITLLLIFIPVFYLQSYFQNLLFTQTRAIRLHSEELNRQLKLEEGTVTYLNQFESNLQRLPLKAKKGILTQLKLKQNSITSNIVYQNTSSNQINWDLFLNFPAFENLKINSIYPVLVKETFVVSSDIIFNSAETTFKNKLTIKQSNNSLGVIFLGSVSISEIDIFAVNTELTSSHTFIIAENQVEVTKSIGLTSAVNAQNSLYFLSNHGKVLIQSNAFLKGCNCSTDNELSCIIINKSLFPSITSEKFLNFREKCIFPNWPAVHEKNEIIGKLHKEN